MKRLPFWIAVSLLTHATTSMAATSTKKSQPLLTAVTGILAEVRDTPDLKTIVSFIDGSPRPEPGKTLEQRAAAISAYIFKATQIVADNSYESRSKQDNILPDAVLATHHGHCLGLTVLFLMIADKQGDRAYLVRAPDHVFPRLCDKKSCVNLEMLQEGRVRSDQYYVENLRIPKSAVERGLYLKSLSSPEEIQSSLYLGLGFVVAKAGQRDVAQLFYKRSSELSSHFAEPWSNLAAVYAESGQTDLARQSLKKAISINPSHYATLVNLGLLELKSGKPKVALPLLDQAVSSNEVSSTAYFARSQVRESLGNVKGALLDLDKVLVIRPEACDAMKRKISLLSSADSNPKALELKALLEKLDTEHRCVAAF